MEFFETIVLVGVPVVLAITLHEAAHGYVARIFGDQTAWMLGRVTLNPLKHIDPIGTVVVPGAMLLLGSPFLFGWAKPVPVNFANLRNPKRDMLWVAAAGPATNFVMAIAWAIVARMAGPDGAVPSNSLGTMALVGYQINLVLMALNLLPIPPLDGGRIAVSVLPRDASNALAGLERYGMFVVLALVVIPGALSTVLRPLVHGADALIRLILPL
ncbi:MAG: site-2 protease family protein [Proteobacteria bacterium]|nr:site-2 protease family protein [Pseudomonadota bacterium]